MDKQANPFASLRIRRQPVHEQIADHIETMLAEKALREGEQLPSERELATTLGVNRASVRQAIYLLQQRGLVETRLGSGSYVTRVSGEIVGQSIERYATFGISSHTDLLALREILEPGVAALAALQADEDDQARLLALTEELEAARRTRQPEGYTAADAEFHATLAAATHNELIVAIMAGLQNAMAIWLRDKAELLVRETSGIPTHTHRRVYEAVAARDAEQARGAMQEHMDFARALLGDSDG